MKKNSFILSLVFFSIFTIHSQSAQVKRDYITRYTQAQVIDSSEGALIYSRMMKVLELDYFQLKSLGYNVQGWNEEYYESGQLMHISYYKGGKVVLFKNFFENGQCQNYITYLDSLQCNIEVYAEGGGLKNQLVYYNGKPRKMTEFYPSGLPKVYIEYDQELNCVRNKKFWYLNAETQSDLQLIDDKQKKYSDKLFYPNGKLKEEGELLYVNDTKEYINTGNRNSFESTGKKKHTEKYKFNSNSN